MVDADYAFSVLLPLDGANMGKLEFCASSTIYLPPHWSQNIAKQYKILVHVSENISSFVCVN